MRWETYDLPRSGTKEEHSSTNAAKVGFGYHDSADQSDQFDAAEGAKLEVGKCHRRLMSEGQPRPWSGCP
jgi:hypothetical protein